MMQADVPGTRTTHGETTKHDAIRMDAVALADGIQRFEDIRFTGPAVGIIGSAEHVELNEILLSGNRIRRIVSRDETHLIHRRAAAVQYYVQPDGSVPIVGFGN